MCLLSGLRPAKHRTGLEVWLARREQRQVLDSDQGDLSWATEVGQDPTPFDMG